ncbi:integrase [Labrenzia sp. EL_126]|nr:integrase [Labrenzia sp. EL_126]
MPNLRKRTVDAAKPGDKTQFVWDNELKGFGLLVLPSGVKSFVVQYRTDSDRSRCLTLGRYGVLTPDQARDLAADALALVRKGKDPVSDRQALKAAPTVSQLMDRYLSEHVEIHNAASTQESCRRIVKNIIRPRLGTLKVASLTRQDITRMHKALASIPRQANLVLSVLSKALTLAEVWGMRPEHSNPVRLVKRYKEVERERFLSAEELSRLGTSLEEAETAGLPWVIKAKDSNAKHLPPDPEKRRTSVNAMALAAIRLLLFTGARLSEVLELQWEHIDLKEGTIALPARKGDGRKAHPVSSGALSVLSNLPRNKKSPFVLPRANDPKRHISKEVLENAWQRVRAHAKLEDVRLHDLRHTVGTFASQAGSNAFMISHLLRHKNVTITNRYVNPDADPIRALSETIGSRIEAGLKGEPE